MMGLCLRCNREVYEIHERGTQGATDGKPNRIGPMLEWGTQVCFLLSDGSSVDVAMCLECANSLAVEEFQAVWDLVCEKSRAIQVAAGRSENQVKACLTDLMSKFPLAILHKRREGVIPGTLVIDRR